MFQHYTETSDQLHTTSAMVIKAFLPKSYPPFGSWHLYIFCTMSSIIDAIWGDHFPTSHCVYVAFKCSISNWKLVMYSIRKSVNIIFVDSKGRPDVLAFSFYHNNFNHRRRRRRQWLSNMTLNLDFHSRAYLKRVMKGTFANNSSTHIL